MCPLPRDRRHHRFLYLILLLGFRHTQQASSVNELDDYMRLPPQDFHSCDPTQWWYSQRRRFPALYSLARDILGIPGLISFPHFNT